MSENENEGRLNWLWAFGKKRNTGDARLNPMRDSNPIRSRQIPRIRKIFWAVTFLSAVGFGFYVRAEIHRRMIYRSDLGLPLMTHQGGTLLIAGGGNLNEMVRRRFVELAGAHDARIVVIPAVPTETSMEGQYLDLWNCYYVKSVTVLHSDSRAQSDDPEFSRALETATGVWLSGGTQSWMAERYGETLVVKRLKDLLERNGVIGGTSAGAAIMSDVMIASGRERPQIGQGFGLIETAIIDQHFVKRNRFRRLKLAIQQHPELIGFGIDEGAALQYSVATGRFCVLGSSCVVACVANNDSDHRHSLRVEFFNPSDEFDIERLRRGDDVPMSFMELDSILLGD